MRNNIQNKLSYNYKYLLKTSTSNEKIEIPYMSKIILTYFDLKKLKINILNQNFDDNENLFEIENKLDFVVKNLSNIELAVRIKNEEIMLVKNLEMKIDGYLDECELLIYTRKNSRRVLNFEKEEDELNNDYDNNNNMDSNFLNNNLKNILMNKPLNFKDFSDEENSRSKSEGKSLKDFSKESIEKNNINSNNPNSNNFLDFSPVNKKLLSLNILNSNRSKGKENKNETKTFNLKNRNKLNDINNNKNIFINSNKDNLIDVNPKLKFEDDFDLDAIIKTDKRINYNNNDTNNNSKFLKKNNILQDDSDYENMSISNKRKKSDNNNNYNNNLNKKEILNKNNLIDQDGFITKRLKKSINNKSLNLPLNCLCPICYEGINNLANLNKCNHNFCKDCIMIWSKKTNLCPMCKCEFNKILYYEKGKQKEYRVKKRKLKDEDYFDENDFIEYGNNESDNCQICKGSHLPDDMLICDSCGFNVCHYTCDNLNQIPEGDWYCLDCRGSINDNNNNINNKDNQSNDNINENKCGDQEKGKMFLLY